MTNIVPGQLTGKLTALSPEDRVNLLGFIDAAFLALNTTGSLPDPATTRQQWQQGPNTARWAHTWVQESLGSPVLEEELELARRLYLLPGSGATSEGALLDITTALTEKGRDYKGYFSSYESACDFESRYLAFDNKQPPPRAVEDPAKEYPADVDGQKALVQRLHAAIFDDSDIMDNKRTLSGAELKQRLPNGYPYSGNTQVDRVNKCSSAECEVLAWKILQATKDAQDGRLNIGRWSEDWKYQIYPTFMDRFVQVEETCKVSKAAVHSLMQASLLKRLAVAPSLEVKRRKNNRSQNALRDVQVKAGINALKRGDVEVDHNLCLKGKNGESIAPAHPIAAKLDPETRDSIRKATKQANTRARGLKRMRSDSPAVAPPRRSTRRPRGNSLRVEVQVPLEAPDRTLSPSSSQFGFPPFDFASLEFGGAADFAGNNLQHLPAEEPLTTASGPPTHFAQGLTHGSAYAPVPDMGKWAFFWRRSRSRLLLVLLHSLVRV